MLWNFLLMLMKHPLCCDMCNSNWHFCLTHTFIYALFCMQNLMPAQHFRSGPATIYFNVLHLFFFHNFACLETLQYLPFSLSTNRSHFRWNQSLLLSLTFKVVYSSSGVRIPSSPMTKFPSSETTSSCSRNLHLALRFTMGSNVIVSLMWLRKNFIGISTWKK